MISPPSISAMRVTTRFMNSRSCEVISSAPGSDAQELLQPDDRLDVEVVGGLVHQQHVGAPQQHARHRHAHLPSTRQRPHVPVDALVVEPETVQHLSRLALERVAAEVVVLFLHLPEPREDPVHVPGRPGSAIACCRASISWCSSPSRPLPAMASSSTLRPGHLLDVLAEVAHRELLRDRHVALVGRLLAHDHAKQGGLAGAVGAHEAHLLAGVELERGVDEEHLTAVLLADAGERDHGDPPA